MSRCFAGWPHWPHRRILADIPIGSLLSGAANIVTHARNITSTARRTDDTRKTARQIKAERKAEQAAIRAEQTRQEKGKKRREIEKRMDMLRKELGDRAYSQLEAEMEGDWDEEVFDRAMDRILAGDIGDVSFASPDLQAGMRADLRRAACSAGRRRTG